MYIDTLNQFASGQSLTSSGASTDYIDLGSDRDVGAGQPLYLVLAVSACDGAGFRGARASARAWASSSCWP